MTTPRGARLLAFVVAGAVLLAVATLWYRAVSDPRPAAPSESPAGTGWKTIEYQGVRVDIPADWVRSDMDGCEFRFEHWAPHGSPACEVDTGLAFYVSATFDPAHGPGVRRTEPNGTDASTWAGYVYAGDFAVYAADDDRDLVIRLLDSARATPD